MTEETKQEDSVNIQISRFGNLTSHSETQSPSKSPRKKDKEIVQYDNSMKISVERKLKKSIINLNLNDSQAECFEKNNKIEIKIEQKKKKVTNIDLNKDGLSKKGVSSPNISPPVSVTSRITRKDIYGNAVIRGPSKRQRVSFVDTLKRKFSNDASNKNLLSSIKKRDFIDFVNVESYKQYNTDVSSSFEVKPKPVPNNCCSNKCLIY